MAVVHASVGVDENGAALVPAGGENYQFIALANVGASVVYLKLVPSAVALTSQNGIPLQPGDVMVVDQDVTPILTSGINAICAVGQDSTVAVQAY